MFAKIGLGGKVFGSSFAGNAVRGALGSAASQGIGVATGLQSKFSWAGVAAAGVAAGVGSAIGGRNGLAPLYGDGAQFTAANVGAAYALRSALHRRSR